MPDLRSQPIVFERAALNRVREIKDERQMLRERLKKRGEGSNGCRPNAAAVARPPL